MTSSNVPVLVELYFHFPPNRIFYSKNHCVKSVGICPYSVQMRGNIDQNNSEYGHFLHNEWLTFL